MEEKLENPKKEYKKLSIVFIGGGVIHDLQCWLCNKESAVYNMYPNWCFEPCWNCQNKIKGKIYRVQNKFIKWLLKS